MPKAGQTTDEDKPPSEPTPTPVPVIPGEEPPDPIQAPTTPGGQEPIDENPDEPKIYA